MRKEAGGKLPEERPFSPSGLSSPEPFTGKVGQAVQGGPHATRGRVCRNVSSSPPSIASLHPFCPSYAPFAAVGPAQTGAALSLFPFLVRPQNRPRKYWKLDIFPSAQKGGRIFSIFRAAGSITDIAPIP
ncbi:hypothetical protein HMPREF0262_00389 [Clostridium sp. ATCC 29733]|nr:hypothetical protein HMPREF0262_00389 [Clostridium sp. ATCC 29733]